MVAQSSSFLFAQTQKRSRFSSLSNSGAPPQVIGVTTKLYTYFILLALSFRSVELCL